MTAELVERETHEGNWYVLVAGLARPKEPLTLAPGVSLVPLESPLSVFDLAAAGAVGFRAWAVLEPISPLCTCEIEAARDSDVVPGYDTLNRAWLSSALLVLRGFTRHLGVACSAYSWNTVAGQQQQNAHLFPEQVRDEGLDLTIYEPRHDLPRFHGSLLEFHTQLLVDRGLRNDEVCDEDVAWVFKNFGTFNRLASESDAFRLALEAAVDWRYTKEERIAIGRIWAGIEALFGISSELVYRISSLCASLLEQRGARGKARFQAVKRLYGLRSKAVHGEKLNQDQLVAAMSDSYTLLRELLVLTIERGRVLTSDDLDDALFG